MFMLKLAFFVVSTRFIQSSYGVDHQVAVGGIGVVKFDPEFLDADIGDTITFTFKQQNHSVSQSSLEAPCEYLPGGFDSGFVPVPKDQTTGFSMARLNVTDKDAVWTFCRQADHCKQGMVFAVNPGDQFDTFKSNAQKSNVSYPLNVPATGTNDDDSCPDEDETNLPAQVTTPSSGNIHVVTVGTDGTLVFSPSNITADIGDSITFRFESGNHTATQCSFPNPCSPLGNSSGSGQVGFDSGLFVMTGTSQFPTYNITLNDTTPIWVYSMQTEPANDCKKGMVFSVNAPATGDNFSAFLATAMGGSIPSAGSTVGVSPSATAKSNSTAQAAATSGAGMTAIAAMGTSALVALFALVATAVL